jgi:hypothetical protein
MLVLPWLFYGITLSYGFDWDDYHFVRIYTLTDVGRAFTGPWDTFGIEDAYYRPLTIAWFALRSWTVGFSAQELHALSIGLNSLLLWICWRWWTAAGVSPLAAAAAAVLLAVHPWFATSGAIWITNQMHLLLLLDVAGACWLATVNPQAVGALLLLQTAAILLKEDGAMLTPMLAVLWWARGVSWPRRWVIGSVALAVAAVGVRWLTLHGLGGPGVPDPGAMWWRGLRELLWLNSPLGLVAGIPVLLLVGVAVARAPGRWWVAPIVCLLLWNLPLIARSAPNRWHGLILMLAWLLAEVIHRAPRRVAVAIGIWTAVVWAALTFGTILPQYAPCARGTLDHDREVQTWPADAVDPRLRAWLVKNCP